MPPEGRAGRHAAPATKIALLLFGAVAFFLYLWAAMRGPVVLWSDSRVDLALARERLGFLGGAAYRDTGGWGHAVKPGYVFFLTVCTALFSDPARASVVLQSILLFAAVAGAAIAAGRARGIARGAAFFVAAVAMLSFRDAASAVMTEALSTAGLLAAAAWAAFGAPPSGRRALLAGAAIAALFLVRPNAGAVAGLLVVVGFRRALFRRRAAAILLAAAFLAVVTAVALARRAHDPAPGRSGVTSALVTGTLDYLWPPSAGPWPARATPAETARAELALTAARWKAMWPPATSEIRRQWIWRAFHGLLGTDFYDARWSGAYWAIDEASKILRPFLVLAAIAWIGAAFRRRDTRAFGVLGAITIGVVVAQSLLFGSLPRYGLPFLAPIFLFAASSATRRFLGPLLGAILLAIAASFRPGILDREWGRIEKPGVVVRQEIPRGRLGRPELHVRIGSLTGATTAELAIEDEAGRRLFWSRDNPHPERPVVVVPLPADLVARNRRRPVVLRFVAGGGFDDTNFYAFPVVPRPWGTPARREGSRVLSPTTGVVSGGLDWW